MDEQHRDVVVTLEINKHFVKAQYDKFVYAHHYSEGNLVLLYDQDRKPLGVGKFNPMWRGPCIVNNFLQKVSHEL